MALPRGPGPQPVRYDFCIQEVTFFSRSKRWHDCQQCPIFKGAFNHHNIFLISPCCYLPCPASHDFTGKSQHPTFNSFPIILFFRPQNTSEAFLWYWHSNSSGVHGPRRWWMRPSIVPLLHYNSCSARSSHRAAALAQHMQTGLNIISVTRPLAGRKCQLLQQLWNPRGPKTTLINFSRTNYSTKQHRVAHFMFTMTGCHKWYFPSQKWGIKEIRTSCQMVQRNRRIFTWMAVLAVSLN